MIRKTLRQLPLHGIDVILLFSSIKRFPIVVSQYFKLKRQRTLSNVKNWPIKSYYPIYLDHKEEAGSLDGHYFHQDLLVATKIFKENPKNHADIGSRIDGFIAHLAVFRTVDVFDIRSISKKIRNVNFIQLDFINNIDHDYKYDSVSSLHVIEHFGLGRYGDPIDYEGYIKGFNNIAKFVKPGGKLYLSTPIGNQRIEFHAHRVFNISTILELAKNEFELITFSYVDDKGDLHENKDINHSLMSSNFNCHYGCGIFEFQKNL